MNTLSSSLPRDAQSKRGTRVPLLFLSLVFLLFPIAHYSLFGLPVYWSETALLLVIVAQLFFYSQYWRDQWQIFFHEEQFFLILITIFLIGVGVSFALHQHTLTGLGAVKSFYIVPVLLAITMPIIIDTPSKARWILWAWLLGIVAIAVAGLGAAQAGWLSYDGRLAGPYTSPNYLAMLIAPGCLLTIFLFQSRFDWYDRMAHIALFCILTVTLWKTASYAAWAAVGVATMTFLCIQKRLTRFTIVAPMFLLIMLGFFFFQEHDSEKWTGLVSGNERTSLASRFMIWRSAVQIASDSWPWGIGPGRFQEAYLAYQHYYPPYLEWAVPTPHNLYLHFFLEGGVLALLGWLGVSVTLMIRFAQVYRSRTLQSISGEPDTVALAMALLTFYLVYGLVDTPYMKNDLALAVWGSIGLAMASLRFRG